MGNVVHRALQRGSAADVRSKYKFKEEIGRGSFATVRRAVRRADRAEFAVKIIKKKLLNEKELQLVHDEVTTMFEIDHPYCCRLFEVFETQDDDHGGKIYMVLELLPGGNLFDKVVEAGAFSERQARLMMWQVTDAMRYLHELGVVHRDLKPENFLFAQYPYRFPVKLTDFGLSRFVHTGWEVMRTGCGTPGYCAPEVLRRHPYTNAVDMWSLGVVFYIVLSGLTPFHSPHGTQATYQRIKRCAYTFNDTQWDHVSEGAKDLIKQLLVVDPEQRLSAEEVLRHPWMHELTPEDRAELGRLPIAQNIGPFLELGPVRSPSLAPKALPASDPARVTPRPSPAVRSPVSSDAGSGAEVAVAADAQDRGGALLPPPGTAGQAARSAPGSAVAGGRPAAAGVAAHASSTGALGRAPDKKTSYTYVSSRAGDGRLQKLTFVKSFAYFDAEVADDSHETREEELAEMAAMERRGSVHGDLDAAAAGSFADDSATPGGAEEKQSSESDEPAGAGTPAGAAHLHLPLGNSYIGAPPAASPPNSRSDEAPASPAPESVVSGGLRPVRPGREHHHHRHHHHRYAAGHFNDGTSGSDSDGDSTRSDGAADDERSGLD